MKIKSIKKESFEGNVYNLELNSNRTEDDLYWIEGESGTVTHNCFPKDIQALMFSAFQMGITPIMLAATITKNDEVRGDRNWEKMDGRAVIKSNNFETVENFASLEDMRNGIETHIAGSAEVEDKNQLN